METSEVRKTCSTCKHDRESMYYKPCKVCHEHVDKPLWQSDVDVVVDLQKDALNPSHYTIFKIQPNTFNTENNLDWLQGNIIKYVCRYPYKGGVTDLKKARHYLDDLIKRTMAEEETNHANQPV